MALHRRKHRRRMVAEINVVPYIDVMLVLLIIFMVTAPLLNQGVEVDLPQAAAEMLPQSDRKLLILTVDNTGQYFLNLAADPDQALDAATVQTITAAALQADPHMPVLVKGDRTVDYGAVVQAMVLLKQAGAEKVGLSTETPAGQDG